MPDCEEALVGQHGHHGGLAPEAGGREVDLHGEGLGLGLPQDDEEATLVGRAAVGKGLNGEILKYEISDLTRRRSNFYDPRTPILSRLGLVD